MRAIQENHEATDAQVAKIVNCARHTVERDRTAEREHKQADYFERYPHHLTPSRNE